MSDEMPVKLDEGMDVRIDHELFHILEAGNGIIRYRVDHSDNEFTELVSGFAKRLAESDIWKIYEDGVGNPTENYQAGRGRRRVV